MIPGILTRDIEILERDYPDACRHIRASQLRYECFTLKIKEEQGYINDWGKNRLKEMEKVPAIQDYAFQKYLESSKEIRKHI